MRSDPALDPLTSLNTAQEGVGRALLGRPVLRGLSGEVQVPPCPGGLTTTTAREVVNRRCPSPTYSTSQAEDLQGAIAHELGHAFGLPHPWEKELTASNHPDHEEFVKARGYSPSQQQVFYNCLPSDTPLFRTIMGLGGAQFPNTGFFSMDDRSVLLAGGIDTFIRPRPLERFLSLDEKRQILANESPRGDNYRRARRDLFFTPHRYAVPTCFDPDGWGLAFGSDRQIQVNRDVLASVNVLTGEGTDRDALIHGYLCPPLSGKYRFWLASNRPSDFYLSPVPNMPDAKQQLIESTRPTQPNEWLNENQSAEIPLEQDKPYYFEVHYTDANQGHVSLAWEAIAPSGVAIQRQLIAGTHLRRFEALSSLPEPNVSVNLAATQFTRYSDAIGPIGDIQGIVSAKAVDSSLDDTETGLFRTPTAHDYPWWEVWLADQPYRMSQVNVRSCRACKDKLSTFYVIVSPTSIPDTVGLSDILQGTATGTYWISPAINGVTSSGWRAIAIPEVTGSVLRIWSARSDSQLALAEVEVYGVPTTVP